MPLDGHHQLPLGVVRAGCLAAIGVIVAALASILLVCVGALRGFHMRIIVALVLSLAFPLFLLALYHPPAAMGLAVTALTVTATWGLAVYSLRWE